MYDSHWPDHRFANTSLTEDSADTRAAMDAELAERATTITVTTETEAD